MWARGKELSSPLEPPVLSYLHSWGCGQLPLSLAAHLPCFCFCTGQNNLFHMGWGNGASPNSYLSSEPFQSPHPPLGADRVIAEVGSFEVHTQLHA